MLKEYWMMAVTGGLCLILGFVLRWIIGIFGKNSAENQAKNIVNSAKKNAEVIAKDAEIEAKDIMFKQREEFEKETKQKREELRDFERRINKKEDNLEAKLELLEKKGDDLKKKESDLSRKDNEYSNKLKEIDKKLKEEEKKLYSISNLSRDEARERLFERIEKEMNEEIGELVRNRLEKAKTSAEKEAGKVLAFAMEKCAGDFVADTAIASVELPDDDMKGRVIGRDGRNIRAFEKATGVDLIVDDTPELVVISCFNGVRREVARIALERLIEDGRIHPTRIEQVVSKTRKDVASEIRTTGEQVLEETGVNKVHPKLVEYLGTLKYRTSYGQNVLRHSVEVSSIAGTIAAELGFDEATARRAGLLHDIGKAIDQDREGTHLEIGAKLARKYNEKETIINAIEAHHECDVEPSSVYTVIVQAADAVSAARPGARRDSLERYIQRMEKLEESANSFNGVRKAYALQAGREIRVMVNAENVNDNASQKLCRDIAKKIENELTYPGEIKVTLIRETRTVEYAR